MNILIVRLGALGDIVHTIPAAGGGGAAPPGGRAAGGPPAGARRRGGDRRPGDQRLESKGWEIVCHTVSRGRAVRRATVGAGGAGLPGRRYDPPISHIARCAATTAPRPWLDEVRRSRI